MFIHLVADNIKPKQYAAWTSSQSKCQVNSLLVVLEVCIIIVTLQNLLTLTVVKVAQIHVCLMHNFMEDFLSM